VDTRKPFFQEFVVQCPRPVNEINAHLLAKHNLIGGYDLGQDYAHLANHMLVAVTEMNTRAQIDTLVTALKELG
jgi:glycine dehydrogenase subunit 1